jgi:hypothetical protein
MCGDAKIDALPMRDNPWQSVRAVRNPEQFHLTWPPSKARLTTSMSPCDRCTTSTRFSVREGRREASRAITRIGSPMNVPEELAVDVACRHGDGDHGIRSAMDSEVNSTVPFTLLSSEGG